MKIYPVVHINSPEQAVEQSVLAIESGADGVYAINHHTGFNDLFIAFNHIAAELGDDAYIGLNLLDVPQPDAAYTAVGRAVDAQKLHRYPNGLWVDNPLHGTHNETAYLEHLARLRQQEAGWLDVRFLGGVAFKYTPQYTADPEQAARQAAELAPYLDVVTTSGSGTGSAPTPEKISAMKAAIGNRPLAVASGVSADNLASYGGQIDELLVASSVETAKYSGIFDAPKLKELIDAVHEQVGA